MKRALAILVLVAGQVAAEGTVITGTVVDAEGNPVADAIVGSNWELGAKPVAYDAVKTDAEGRFSITLRYYRPPTALLAYDASFDRAAGVLVPEADAASPQTLKLAPVISVTGSFACTDKAVEFAGVSIQWQLGKARIGNFYAKGKTWESRLPPGAWSFWTYSPDLAPFSREFNLAPGSPALDLGTLEVPPTLLATLAGKPLPKWTVSDARGAEKTVQVADYKGRWLLIEFWGFW